MARHGSAPAEYPSLVAPPAGSGRGGGPATWPIRRKLATLVALPTAVVIGLIGALVAQSFLTWRASERADAASEALLLANAVTTAVDVELQGSTDLLLKASGAEAKLATHRTATDTALRALQANSTVGADQQWSAAVQGRWTAIESISQTLPSTRQLVDDGKVNLITVAQGYEVALQPVRDLTTDLSTELGSRTPNPRAVDSSSVLSAVATAASFASREIVLLTSVLNDNTASIARVSEIQQAGAGQSSLLELARTRATAAQRTKIDDVRARDFEMATLRANGLLLARNGSGVRSPESQNDALQFSTQASARLAVLDQLVSETAQDLKNQTSSDARAALLRLLFLSSLALISLILIILLVSSLSRTITAPMRRLRSGAVDAATVRLPAAVRQIEREGPEAVVDVPPVLPADAKVGPETREVAQALDGLTGEAIRLATSQVRLRQSLDEAFVSMSRRSQAMVEKQLAIIDELESTEEDADQLRNLFRLDHLAARMRRYNDNLLVLAGSAVRTRSAAPVAVADVFRAATSEMEQYERVRLQPLSGASIAGAAAGGLIHLLAELLDNAAMYSPPTSPIVLSATYTSDGGLRLAVTDSGVGIPPTEVADLNARLSSPGTIDTQVPSRMGLYVVARLAQRGGFQVRLSPRPQAAGTVAEVTVAKSMVLGAPTGPLAAIRDGQPIPATPGIVDPPRLPAQQGVGPSGPVRPAPSRPGQGRPGGPSAPPTIRPAHTPPAALSGAPGGGSGPSVGGLPSRRPGAALAANPLGAQAAEAPAPAPARGRFGADTGRADKTGAGVAGDSGRTGADDGAAGTTAVPSTSPFGLAPPWAAAPAGTRPADGRTPDGLTTGPSGEPGSDRVAAAAPESGQPTGLPKRTPGTTHHGPAPFSTRPAAESRGGITFEPNAPVADAPAAASIPASAPGHRPGARPLPVRAPGQPGGGPAIGPSAAAAVAAAAAARPRPTSSGAGLFAATGPSLDAVGRQQPDGDASGDVAAPAASVAPVAPVEPVGRVEPAQVAPAPEPPPMPQWSGGMGSQASTSFEQQAREAAASRYQPADPEAPMIGTAPGQPERAHTPIFDSISVWFSDDRTAAAAPRVAEPVQVIDLRDPAQARPGAEQVASGQNPVARQTGTGPGPGSNEVGRESTGRAPSRWSSLGDQRWVAANARASSAPQTAGSTTTGLPRRRPGANLLPSAAAAAGAPTAAVTPPARRTDAESVRGRLGSYQRGLSSARRARHLPGDSESRGLFGATTESGSSSGRQGGDS